MSYYGIRITKITESMGRVWLRERLRRRWTKNTVHFARIALIIWTLKWKIAVLNGALFPRRLYKAAAPLAGKSASIPADLTVPVNRPIYRPVEVADVEWKRPH